MNRMSVSVDLLSHNGDCICKLLIQDPFFVKTVHMSCVSGDEKALRTARRDEKGCCEPLSIEKLVALIERSLTRRQTETRTTCKGQSGGGEETAPHAWCTSRYNSSPLAPDDETMRTLIEDETHIAYVLYHLMDAQHSSILFFDIARCGYDMPRRVMQTSNVDGAHRYFTLKDYSYIFQLCVLLFRRVYQDKVAPLVCKNLFYCGGVNLKDLFSYHQAVQRAFHTPSNDAEWTYLTMSLRASTNEACSGPVGKVHSPGAGSGRSTVTVHVEHTPVSAADADGDSVWFHKNVERDPYIFRSGAAADSTLSVVSGRECIFQRHSEDVAAEVPHDSIVISDGGGHRNEE
ncbi:hypothetical protein STCU_12357 [Strigomonas culicis]|uniref:Uncharacterized protein n=1 Tax=Strigomonas culicis TaxID=28005 RepID=S9UX42_9TRYP|nr:hypothetical protein STCU_12357 [Strigomonas culicis]|eukprot:EPY15080.1 hypothetical protein STCU_12357 [Strigomonas culicis]